MNIKLFIKRVEQDSDTIIAPSKILTKEEIDRDKYLTSAYYLHTNIRIVTARHLLSDTLGGVQFPPIQRGIDISQYAYDYLLKEGRCLFFYQHSTDYGIFKSLKDKTFISFGDNRQIPFGIDNFISPTPNALNITEPFTYNKPILIVEGLRDCLDAQTIYPYTLAMQTAGIPKVVQLILSSLTSNLILGFDNDEPGRKALKLAHYLPFSSTDLLYPLSYKDIGTLSELYHDSYKFDFYKEFLTNQLSLLT